MLAMTKATQLATSVSLRALMHNAEGSYSFAAVHRLPESKVHCCVEGGGECQVEVSILSALFQWSYWQNSDTPLVRVRGCQGLPIVPTRGQGRDPPSRQPAAQDKETQAQ
jgi:hypothetical protein